MGPTLATKIKLILTIQLHALHKQNQSIVAKQVIESLILICIQRKTLNQYTVIYIKIFPRSMAIIDPSGHWTGEEDGGSGSPMIRHTGCRAGGPAKKPYIVDVKQATDPA